MTERREPGIPTPSDDDEPQKRLSRRLREAREYLGLAQQFVADQTGIPRAAVSAIETGRRRVEALELERLAAVYKFPVAYFLEGSLEEPASVRALAREAVELTEDDRAEVLRFAQFLKGFGDSRPRPTRGRG
jgi:transcriptional regulator with XRE-family HTH domain